MASRPAQTRAADGQSSGFVEFTEQSGWLDMVAAMRSSRSKGGGSEWRTCGLEARKAARAERPCKAEEGTTELACLRQAGIALSGLNPEPEASSGRIPLNLIKHRIALQPPCDYREQLIRLQISANSLYIQSMEFLTKIIDSELLRSVLTLLASIFSSPLFKKI